MILVRRKISSKGLPTGEEEVDIRGPLLQQALADIHKDTEGFTFDEEPPQVMQPALTVAQSLTNPTIEPRLLFHSQDALAALLKTKNRDDPEDQQFIFELEAALRYIKEDFDNTFTSLSNLLPENQITFAHLWSIFPPNTIIYGLDTLRNPRAWTARSVEERQDQQGNSWLRINPEHIDYDGIDVGVVESESDTNLFGCETYIRAPLLSS